MKRSKPHQEEKRLKWATYLLILMVIGGIGPSILSGKDHSFQELFSTEEITGAATGIDTIPGEEAVEQNATHINVAGMTVLIGEKVMKDKVLYGAITISLLVLIILIIIILHHYKSSKRKLILPELNLPFKENLQVQAVSGQKPTPRSGWDAQLQSIDQKLASLDNLPKVRIIRELPRTHGIPRDTIESSPEYHQENARNISTLLVQGIRKPHLLVTKKLHSKDKSESEKQEEEEYQKLLHLHSKIDHYSQLSGRERLELEYELRDLKKKMNLKD